MHKEIEDLQLLGHIRFLIEESKKQVAVTVNATMSMLYWQIGKKINDEVAQHHGETYGKQIVATLWRQLSAEYGNSFSEKNLRRMMQFAEIFPDEKIVVSLIRQLTFRKIPGNSRHRQTATEKFGKHGNRGHLCTKQIICF